MDESLLPLFLMYSVAESGIFLGVTLKLPIDRSLCRLLRGLVKIYIVLILICEFLIVVPLDWSLESKTALIATSLLALLTSVVLSRLPLLSSLSARLKNKTERFSLFPVLLFSVWPVLLPLVFGINLIAWGIRLDLAGLFFFLEGLSMLLIIAVVTALFQQLHQRKIYLTEAPMPRLTPPEVAEDKLADKPIPSRSVGRSARRRSPTFGVAVGAVIASVIILRLSVPSGVHALVVLDVRDDRISSLNVYFNPSFPMSVLQPSGGPGNMTIILVISHENESLHEQAKTDCGNGTHWFRLQMPSKFSRGHSISVSVELCNGVGRPIDRAKGNFTYQR